MKKKAEAKRLPPGPRKLPIIGNIHQISQPLHQSLRRLSNKHGPLMHLQLGSVPTLVVSSAAMAKEVLKTHDLIFANRPSLYASRKSSYNYTDVVLAPYGSYWREVRKIAVIELLSAKRVESFKSIREEEVAHMIKTVSNSSLESNPINVTKLIFMVVNNVVIRVTFSKKGNHGEEKRKSGTREFGDIINESLDLISVGNIAELFPWMGWYNKLNGVEAGLEKNFRDLDSFYDMVIQEHRERSGGSEHEDLVDVLLRVQDDPNQEIRLTNANIKGVLNVSIHVIKPSCFPYLITIIIFYQIYNTGHVSSWDGYFFCNTDMGNDRTDKKTISNEKSTGRSERSCQGKWFTRGKRKPSSGTCISKDGYKGGIKTPPSSPITSTS